MNKYISLTLLVLSVVVGQLRAQNSYQAKADFPVKKQLLTDARTGKWNTDFKGTVILDEKRLEKGLKSIASFPVDTVKTVTYIAPENMPASLISIDPDCQYGIYVLSTSEAQPALRIDYSKLETIILNFKIPLYKNTPTEPE